jgi:hypothetical protein
VGAVALMTQGKTKKEAFFMIQDAFKELLGDPNIEVSISDIKGDYFLLSVPYSKEIVGFIAQRARLNLQLSLRGAADLVGAKSRNTFAQYEAGSHDPTGSTLFKMLDALQLEVVVRRRAS